MKEKDKYWIWLSIFKDLKNKTIQELIKKFGTIEEIYKAKKKELLTVNGINEDIADQMTNEIYKRKTYKYQKCMEKAPDRRGDDFPDLEQAQCAKNQMDMQTCPPGYLLAGIKT